MSIRPLIVAAALGCLPTITLTNVATAAQDSSQPAGVPGAGFADARVLMERAIDAMGGRKAFEGVKSSVKKIKAETLIATLDIEVWSMGERRTRVTTRVSSPAAQGAPPRPMEIQMSRNEDATWLEIQPLNPETMEPMGRSIVQPMPDASQLDSFADAARAHWIVHRMLEDYATLETVGIEEFRGVACVKIRASDPQTERAKAEAEREPGDRYFFISAADGMPKGVDVPAPPAEDAGPNAPMRRQTFEFSDVRGVGDLKLFHRMEVTLGGTTQAFIFERIELNVLQEAVFDVPEQIKAMQPPPANEATPPAAGGNSRPGANGG